MENTQITEEQRTALEEELTAQRLARLQEMELSRASFVTSTSATMFGDLSNIAKAFGGEQTGVFKALFAVSKAFAVADATIKIQQGIANALSLPWPTNLGAMAQVTAAASSIVTTIGGTQFSGAYDNGGFIPAGKFGITGEVGPEIVQGPATVTSRKKTAQMLKDSTTETSGQAQPPQTNIRVVNAIDPSVMGDFLGSDEGEELIMNTLRNNPELVQSISGA